ncbi:hypothetical protein CYQ27_10555 [Enterococcus faecalis]|nr:hypothetical protein HMPREF9377_02582 [Enterococcus faecalis R712]EFQ08639.1 hypothetical protein HMPREF9492_02982 [Enterococcus faecalis DAPTO 512]EGO8793091.1 hypothetical protein [Enterococcus faecalis]PIO20698.1 hypothetical protein CE092_08345 [Enterococcus faecalis]PJO01457.1 hypothetical protein CS914_007085 [Enterococcus faecalis]
MNTSDIRHCFTAKKRVDKDNFTFFFWLFFTIRRKCRNFEKNQTGLAAFFQKSLVFLLYFCL